MGRKRISKLGLLLSVYLMAALCLSAANRYPTKRRAARTSAATLAPAAAVPPTLNPPILSSTYLGGTGYEIAWSCAVDRDGNVYIGGDAQPGIGASVADFPVTANALQKNYAGGGQDGFVAKYDRNGQLLWSTYLGGSNWDGVFAVAVDDNNNVVATGVTESSDFPITANAVQNTIAPNTDVAFVTVISADGTQVLYSTFLGGTQGDGGVPLPVRIPGVLPPGDTYTIGVGLKVGNDGTIYVVGGTNTIDMPVTPAVTAAQPVIGGEEDAFVARIDPTKAGSAGLVYCTYLGGALGDFAAAVAIDASGNAFVTGEAQSQIFPTTAGAFQRTHTSGTAAFVTKLDPAGTTIIYSTLVSGSQGGSATSGTNYNAPSAIVIDSLGQAYIDGETNAIDFPTTAGVVQPAPAGKNDAFVTELSADGSALVFSTYLGGSESDGLFGIQLDRQGNIVVGGYTGSANAPMVRAFQPNYVLDIEGWVAELSPAGSALLFSSYLAGNNQDSVYGLDLWNDEIYLAGRTASTDFPVTSSAPQKTYGGDVWDVFLTQVNLNPVMQITSINRLPNGHAIVTGRGGALSSITIEAAPDLLSSFAPVKSITTDFSGTFQYDDVDAVGLSQKFYRASLP